MPSVASLGQAGGDGGDGAAAAAALPAPTAQAQEPRADDDDHQGEERLEPHASLEDWSEREGDGEDPELQVSERQGGIAAGSNTAPRGDPASQPRAAGNGGGEGEGVVAAPLLSFQWSLASFLPPALQEALEVLLNEFVYLPWKEAQRAAAASAAAGGAAGGDDQQGGGGGGAVVGAEAQVAYLARALPTTITQNLLQLVGEVCADGRQAGRACVCSYI